MRRKIFIIQMGMLFILMASVSRAQNIVPNSSFEAIQNRPIRENINNAYEYEPSSGHIPFTVNLTDWKAGSDATPDLRIKDEARLRDCLRVLPDCDFPHKGDHAVGIITYLKNMETLSYREYIQVKFTEPMRVGEPINYSIWIAKERLARLVSNNIGFYFSFREHIVRGFEPYKFKPQINIDSLINPAKRQWVEVRGTYVPDKPYTYMMIGNFYGNDETELQEYPNYLGSARTPPYAYYLLDDIKFWYNELPEEDFEEEWMDEAEVAALAKDSIVLNFEIAKYELTDQHFLEINSFFAKDTSAQQYHFIIEGSTDFLGDDESNQTLSEQRAQSLHQYVQERYNGKIASIKYKGVGELLGQTAIEDGDRGVPQHRRVLLYLDPLQVPKKRNPRKRRPTKIAELSKMKAGEKLTLKGLNFIKGETRLVKKSIPLLIELKDFLLAHPTFKIEIAGHVCCSRGPIDDELSQNLSEGRAKNIYDYLLRKGIAAERLSYVGHGMRQPIVHPEVTDKDRQKNRRVELRILE